MLTAETTPQAKSPPVKVPVTYMGYDELSGFIWSSWPTATQVDPAQLTALKVSATLVPVVVSGWRVGEDQVPPISLADTA